jgi:D-tagatose-1,6-bisphosphate aldolase subunit GatZ/KbaZ
MDHHRSSLDHAREVLAGNLLGRRLALTSVCSAHPLVLRAALSGARDAGQIALIEATCNQVNQDGGYTGMRPADFVARVAAMAQAESVPMGAVLLGGDHLGPQPWRARKAAEAMAKAEAMLADYVAAGFQKIHLDCSMRCADDPDPLPESLSAGRAARLAAVAEKTADAAGLPGPIYVIGTEVPPPGGMGDGHAITATDPAHVARTWDTHRAAFDTAGQGAAFERVCAIVVQPGLDFGNEEVVQFDPDGARALSASVRTLGHAVFEAHSTDYQRPSAYRALVEDHFAILKVGPAATFALREAIYALDRIDAELSPSRPGAGVRAALEQAMLSDPSSWRDHYRGDADHVAWLRHFSYSDRLRYYWTVPAVMAEVEALFARLDARDWPLPLVSQYLPALHERLAESAAKPTCSGVAIAAVRRALAPYWAASDRHFPATKEH